MSHDQVKAHEITLWKIWLPDFERYEEFYFSVLSTDEKERAQAFVTPMLRRRYTLSQGILREILASYLSVHPKEIEYSRGIYKKPHLAGSPKGLEFNMSHSADMVVIGISFGAPIGVDVEKFRRGPEESLEESVFSKSEQAQYDAIPEEQKMEAFFAAWTHKEALTKLAGVGLYKDFKSVEVPVHVLPQPTTIVYERTQENLQSLILDQDYIAAVASPKRGFKLEVRDFKPREALMMVHPFFESFSKKDITELAKLATEKHFCDGEIIIKEGDLVDSVYLIYSGQIELSIAEIPRRAMQPGEAIGLAEKGLYSESGMRTATLKAIGDVELFGWPLDVFNRFLEHHPEYMKTTAPRVQKMLRAAFVKRAAPFAKLPNATVLELVDKIEELTLPAQTLLFKQGDQADKFYLVLDGEVQILLEDKDKKPRVIATMTAGQSFGEASVLGIPFRGASAQVSKEAKLLALKAEQLDSLMQHTSTSEAMRLLVMNHWRPHRVEPIEFYGRHTDEGFEVVVLKDKARRRYHQLSQEGWRVWQQLNGQRSLKELTSELAAEPHSLKADAIVKIIRGLAEAGFVNLPHLKATGRQTPIKKWEKIAAHIKSWFR